MKTKKYWLRSGIIFTLLYTVVVLINMPTNLTANLDEFILELSILQYPVTVLEVLFNIYSNTILSLIIGGIITWFVLGAIIGWIYGKIKRVILSRK